MSSNQKKSFVTRDAFLNSPLPFEDVDLARFGIPAWVRVNALNATQLGEYGDARAEVPEELRGSVLLVFTLSDNAGQALFTMDDLDALERTPQKRSIPVITTRFERWEDGGQPCIQTDARHRQVQIKETLNQISLGPG